MLLYIKLITLIIVKHHFRKKIIINFAKKRFNMKQFTSKLLRVSTLLAIALLAFSCRKDKEDEPTTTNEITNYFTINNDKYELKSGSVINNGETDYHNGFDLDLSLYCSDTKDFISFKIISEQAENILSNTYTEFEGAWILDYNSEDGSYSNSGTIESGKLIVDRTSSGYILDFECLDQYGNDVKGYYKGNLIFKDEESLVHAVPNYVLPAEIYEEVTSRLPVYSGITPPNMTGEYVSSPHILFYESYAENPDSIQYYADRYIGFMYNNKQMNFYGKQDDLEEIQYGVKVTGEEGHFTCYYVVDGYPGGYYAQQSFIFSGKKTDDGIEDFHTAVILLETSGHPDLPANNSYRVLKDEDGLAENNNWLSKKSNKTNQKVSDEDLFKMWIK